GIHWRHVLVTTAAAALAALAVWLWQRPHVNTLESEVAEKKARIEQLAPLARDAEGRLAEQTALIPAARAEIAALREAGTANLAYIAELEERLAALSDQFRMVTAPTVRTAELASTSSLAPDAVARAFVSEDDGRVQVSLARFTQAPAGQTYQLWILTAGQPPTSLGLVEVGAEGAAVFDGPLPPTEGAKLAIAVSLEEAGGKPTPEGKIIAYGVLGP
ncbi:MAG: anti-sigma factor, partial [Planctomycetota bacterium]